MGKFKCILNCIFAVVYRIALFLTKESVQVKLQDIVQLGKMGYTKDQIAEMARVDGAADDTTAANTNVAQALADVMTTMQTIQTDVSTLKASVQTTNVRQKVGDSSQTDSSSAASDALLSILVGNKEEDGGDNADK